MSNEAIDIDGGILVGHDGSASSDHALRWALRLAQGLDTAVTVVRAWVLSTAPRPAGWSQGYMPPLDDFGAAALAALDEDIATTLSEYAGVEVHTQTVHGRPTKHLIDASEHADMVVVGRRGLGGFAGLVLGSSSEQVVRHSQGAVIVVNPGVDAPQGEGGLVMDEGLA